MLTLPAYDGLDPFEDPLDRLLAQIAIELQLPPSLFDQAGDLTGRRDGALTLCWIAGSVRRRRHAHGRHRRAGVGRDQRHRRLG